MHPLLSESKKSTHTTVNAISVYCLLLVLFSCSSQQKQVENHSPEDERATFQFADSNLQASLIASEPNIISPVDIAWSPAGILYVAEMPGYPTKKGSGAIKQLTDPDGDGFYDKMSVFDDELNFPTSVMYFNGGILVADAPNIYFLKDEDRDGKADVKTIVLTGFTKGNEQLLVNDLQWGLDNWIYGANGRSGGNIKFTGSDKEVSISNRDFRFNIFDQKLEAISGMSQFGLARDDWGNRFISYNHRFARQVVLEEQYLDRNPSLATEAIFDTYQNEHDRRVYTLLQETMRFNRDPIGYFTSLSGLTAYRGHLLGPEYEGSFFAGESVQAAVIHRKMISKGVTFTAINPTDNKEFLASSDDWFHPVNFSNGPDGALYMIDFYRKFVEHPEWAHKDKREGVDWNLGENNGRIWRIARKEVHADTSLLKPDFHRLSIEELVNQLGSVIAWRREMAQQLLIEGQIKEAAPHLEKMLGDDRVLARLHAIWTLDGLGLLTERHILISMKDDDPRMQVQGIHLAEKKLALSSSESLLKQIGILSRDVEPLVRFHAVLVLGGKNTANTRETLVKIAADYDDAWTRIALLSSTASWAGTFSRKLFESNQEHTRWTNNDYSFFRQLGKGVAISTLDAETEQWMSGLTQKAKRLLAIEAAFLAGYLEALKTSGMEIPRFSEGFASEGVKMAHSKIPEIAKMGIELLRYINAENLWQELLEIVLSSKSEEISIAGLQSIASLNDPSLSSQMYQSISDLNPTVRKALISSSRTSDAATFSLFNAIQKQTVNLTEIPEELRQAFLAHSNEKIKQKATDILGSAINQDRQAIIDQYLRALNQQTVDLSNGANIFFTNCSTCHSIKGKGGLLGPDLTNIGNRNDDIILTSILDPSRMVSYELRLHVIETHSGEVFSGTTSAETVSSITIRNPGGETHTILKKNIKKQTVTDQSIMPEGYERIIDQKGMADLIGFLRNPNHIDLSN